MTDDEIRAIRQKQLLLKMHAKATAPAAEPSKDFRGTGLGAGTALEAGLIGARQGVTLGFGDEMNAGVRAIGDMFGGKPFGEAYDQRLAHERGLLNQVKVENPKAELAGEIGGAVLLPAGPAGTATTAAGAAARGAVGGAAFGAAYGAGNEEGGVGNRAEGAAKGLAFGGLFGAGAGAAISVGTKAFRRLYNGAVKKPTVESLRAAKSVAYRAVDNSGEAFDQGTLQSLAKTAREAIEEGNYVPGTDTQTDAALTLLDRHAASGKSLKIGQLDKLRQDLWKRYNAAPNENGILDAIDAIDETIAARADTNELMQAARAANAQYKKAELLEVAFKKAQDQTSATGSGGNILNKYRQAVEKIVNDPKRAKWFNEDEIGAMQKIIDGDLPENILRRVGKMAPTGNGLMMFLNLMGGAAFGPGFLGVTAAGVAAKGIADASAKGSVDALVSQVGGGQAPRAVQIPRSVNALTGLYGSR